MRVRVRVPGCSSLLPKCFLFAITSGLCPPRNPSEILNPLGGKKCPGAAGFFVLSSILHQAHLFSVIKRFPFDLEINFQRNPGIQMQAWARGAPRGAAGLLLELVCSSNRHLWH